MSIYSYSEEPAEIRWVERRGRYVLQQKFIQEPYNTSRSLSRSKEKPPETKVEWRDIPIGTDGNTVAFAQGKDITYITKAEISEET